MKKIIWISAVLFIAILFGCKNIYKKDIYDKVTSDYDKSVTFRKYKTFSWLPDKADTINSPYNNEIIRNNIRNYFGQCMSDRGYSFDAESPDLLMQLVIINTKKGKGDSTHPTAYYYNPYYYGSQFYSPYHQSGNYYYYNHYASYGDDYFGAANIHNREYVNGSISLIFIDRKANKIVWTGTAQGDIYDPSNINKDLHPAVHSIIAEYPIKPLVNRSHEIK